MPLMEDDLKCKLVECMMARLWIRFTDRRCWRTPLMKRRRPAMNHMRREVALPRGGGWAWGTCLFPAAARNTELPALGLYEQPQIALC